MEPWRADTSPVPGYGLALLGAVAAIVVAALAKRWFGLEDLSLVFIVAVLLVASRTSTGPAIVASLLSFLGYNFFFFEPRYTFYISARDGVATIVLFLAAALVAGRLASRLAMRVLALRRANFDAAMRQALGQRLAVATDEQAITSAASNAFEAAFYAQAWIRLQPTAAHAQADPGAARVVAPADVHAQGAASEQHGWWFLELATVESTLGTIGLKLPESWGGLDVGQRHLAQLMADDVAQALWRTRLASALESQRVATETERLRSALLASVSHDLRTPLAVMLGAAESLDSYGANMDEADRRALLDTIREDGQRLDRYIQNLLDMTRIGQGGIALERDWIGMDELIGSALGRLRRYRPETNCKVHFSADVTPVWVHPGLFEQVIFNVLENAMKFSPRGQAMGISVAYASGNASGNANSEGGDDDGDGDGNNADGSNPGKGGGNDVLRIEVDDQGPGIPEQDRERVFDMFYSVGRGDRGHAGTGLGLAICRGILRAHGGTIIALAGREGHGTTIRIDLPRASRTPGGQP